MKKLFIQYFQPFVASFVASLHSVNNVKTAVNQATTWDFVSTFQHWDTLFDKLLKGLEEKASQVYLSAHCSTGDNFKSLNLCRIANHACVQLFDSQLILPPQLLMIKTLVISNILGVMSIRSIPTI